MRLMGHTSWMGGLDEHLKTLQKIADNFEAMA
jgi:hypothetical protein